MVSLSGHFVFRTLQAFSGCNARFFVGGQRPTRAPLSERCRTEILNIAAVPSEQLGSTLSRLVKRGLRYAQEQVR